MHISLMQSQAAYAILLEVCTPFPPHYPVLLPLQSVNEVLRECSKPTPPLPWTVTPVRRGGTGSTTSHYHDTRSPRPLAAKPWITDYLSPLCGNVVLVLAALALVIYAFVVVTFIHRDTLTRRRIGFTGYSEQYRIAGVIVEAALLLIIAFTNNVRGRFLTLHLTHIYHQYILWRERRLRYSEFAAKVRHLCVHPLHCIPHIDMIGTSDCVICRVDRQPTLKAIIQVHSRASYHYSLAHTHSQTSGLRRSQRRSITCRLFVTVYVRVSVSNFIPILVIISLLSTCLPTCLSRATTSSSLPGTPHPPTYRMR